MFNEEFAAKIGAELIRDDDIFNAAVVSFGTFGIIAAMAVETGRSTNSNSADRRHQLRRPQGEAQPGSPTPPEELYHYEFIFDPNSRKQMAMEASAPKVPYNPASRRRSRAGCPRQERLRSRDQHPEFFGFLRAIVPPRLITGMEFRRIVRSPC